jgi:hypothetical protein
MRRRGSDRQDRHNSPVDWLTTSQDPLFMCEYEDMAKVPRREWIGSFRHENGRLNVYSATNIATLHLDSLQSLRANF